MKSRFVNSRNLSSNSLGTITSAAYAKEGDPYWASTSLLLKGDGPSGGNNSTFIDSGPYGLTIAKNGVVGTSSNSPLIPAASSGIEYSPIAHGGSCWLNGTASDYLSIGYNSTALELGSSDFTLECWIYASTPASASQGIFAGNADFHYGIMLSASKMAFLASSNGSNWDINGTSGATTILANTWYHFAVTRSGSTWKTFVNGVQDYTWTSSAVVISRSEAFNIGRWGNASMMASGSQISGLRLVKGAALYTNTFTPPTLALTSVTNTTLLCNFTNFAVYDSTGLTKSIETRGNSATMVTQSKYGGSSIYFDGAGDYLLLRAQAELGMGSGDFTIEMWYYPVSVAATAYLLDVYDGNSAGRLIITQTAGGGVQVAGQTGGNLLTTTALLTAGQWNHIAAVRAGGYLMIYVNGSLYTGSIPANSTTFTCTTGNVAIGIAGSDLATAPANGYIDDLRMTKGIARYTANFTPATRALPAFFKEAQSDPYWGNVSFLTHADGANNKNNRLVIDEIGANSITTVNAGSPGQGSLSPFSLSSKWDALVNGGSASYDGTGDCIHKLDQSLSTNAFADFGNGSFTVETWFSLNALPGVRKSLFSINLDGSGYGSIVANITSSNKIGLSLQEGTGAWKYDDTATGLGATLVANTWYHLAIERTAGSASVIVYLDGNQIGSYALTATTTVLGQWATTRSTYIGGYNTSNTLNGLLSSFRVVKGRNVYGGTFVRPTTPAKNVANTTLLVNFTNAAIWDEKARSVLNTVADSKSMATQPRYGQSSIALDGTGDWITGYNPDGYAEAGGDFTLECWFYQSARGTAQYGDGILTLWKDVVAPGAGLSTTNPGITIRFASSANDTPNLSFYTGTTMHTNISASTGVIALNTWHHIAATKQGSVVRLFVNGVKAGEVTTSSITATTFRCLIIGAAPDGASPELQGYIDEVRITKGVARYTGNFIVPSQSFLDR